MIVKGAGGNLKVMGSGTLLSPQHWAQGLNDNSPRLDGTWCATYADRCVLEWNQRKNRRTIPFDRNYTNTPIIYSAPGNILHRRKIAILDVVAKTTQICQTVAYSSTIDENSK